MKFSGMKQGIVPVLLVVGGVISNAALIQNLNDQTPLKVANTGNFQHEDEWKQSTPDLLLDQISEAYGASEQDSEHVRNQFKDLYSSILKEDKHFLSSVQSHLKSKLNIEKTSRKSNENVFKANNFDEGKWDAHVTSSDLPDYKLRVKKPDPSKLGIDHVKQYSGYLDIESEDKHFFYWFFESRNDPKNDPVILWLNGGPGCSSFIGLFFELGPSLMTIEKKVEYNPFSWNNNASVIFVDQPINVGFSYAGKNAKNGDITNSFAAAEDVFALLQLFFLKFPEYAELPFHIAGESYAGVYIPLIAKEILSHDRAMRSFDLTSVLIGNGITDPLVQYKHYQPMLCGKGWEGHQVIPDERCEQMLREEKTCTRLVETCYKTNTVFLCLPALLYCDTKVGQAVSDYNINAYDIRMVCGGEDSCYPEQDVTVDYLNQAEIKEAIGADVGNYQACSGEVFNRFLLTADQIKPYQKTVAELLDVYNLPVLIYAGDKDYICNWLGNQAWTNELEYTGHFSFEFAETQKYYTLDSGNYAGDVKNFENFTFVRLFDAGHMVPHDQGENSLDMVNRWINGDYALGTSS